MSEKSIFISYSRSDSEFTLKLAKDLRSKGADIWLDQLDIEPGMRWDRAISKALGEAKTLMIVLSQSAMDSDNVMDEVSFAFDESKRIIPIMKEQCEVDFRLRRLQFTDFTGDYNKGLKTLAKTLKLQEQQGGSERSLAKDETSSEEHQISQPEDLKEASAIAKSSQSIAPIKAEIKEENKVEKTAVNSKIETNTKVSNEALNQDIESIAKPGRASSSTKVSKPFWVRYKYLSFWVVSSIIGTIILYIDDNGIYNPLDIVVVLVICLVLTMLLWLMKKIFGSRKKSKT